MVCTKNCPYYYKDRPFCSAGCLLEHMRELEQAHEKVTVEYQGGGNQYAAEHRGGI